MGSKARGSLPEKKMFMPRPEDVWEEIAKKRGGTAFNFEGTENENSLVLGGIYNSRTDQHSEKTSPLPASIS